MNASSRRFQDWPLRLARFVAEREREPFSWGRNDCCLFACDCVRELTGIDPAEGIFRGKYDSAYGAQRLLVEHGGVEAIAEKQTAACGFAEIPPRLAQRGDLVMIDMPVTGPAMGIRIDARAVVPAEYRLMFFPAKQARRAWRVA